MRAAIYCRISQDQTGEAAGVTRQLEDCERLIDAQGWTLVETFVDNDISATSGKVRPEYRRLLASIRGGELDAVVAWHPDRLYRKLGDLEELLNAIEKQNVIMRTVRAGEIDLSTPTGRMIARILSSVATAEGEMKSDRWRRSVTQRREAGTFAPSGPRMYGYTREGRIIEDEAEHIRWMADEIATGRSLTSLAREVEDRDIRTTNGNVWPKQALHKLLTNPKLAGWATLNGEIVGRGTWDPILDPEAWEGVRAALTVRAGTAPGRTRVALLPGIIYCGGCDAPMVTGSRTTKRGGLTRTYRCTREPGQGGCMKVSAQAGPVEEVVEAFTRAALDDPRVRARLADLRAQPGPQQHEIAELELRITELEQQLDEPGTPVATILRAIDRAKEKQETLLRELAAHPRTQVPAHGAEWPKDLRRRRALVDLVIERVTVKPSTTPGQFDPARVVIDPR